MGIVSYTSFTVAFVKINEGDFPSSGVTAHIQIKQDKDDVIRITGSVQGLPPTNSSKYGLHVHEHSISDNDCMKAGTHFNPLSNEHGAPGGILGMAYFFCVRQYELKSNGNNTPQHQMIKY